jgi:hypothetical protein
VKPRRSWWWVRLTWRAPGQRRVFGFPVHCVQILATSAADAFNEANDRCFGTYYHAEDRAEPASESPSTIAREYGYVSLSRAELRALLRCHPERELRGAEKSAWKKIEEHAERER